MVCIHQVNVSVLQAYLMIRVLCLTQCHSLNIFLALHVCMVKCLCFISLSGHFEKFDAIMIGGIRGHFCYDSHHNNWYMHIR